MSCSISRMVSSPLSARSVATMRPLSSGPIPASGSSSRRRRGPVASAIAISSWRCSPWLSLATRTSAREASPTRARAARAGSRRRASPRAGRQKRKECPACACTASATLSRAVKSANSEVIWNERASPSRLRRQLGNRVTSPPSKRIRPSSGAISPESSPISVVLPAPFGPMTACSSPLGTASEIASEATTPKRLVKESISSRASTTALSRQQAVDAAAREQHDQQEQRAEHDLPIFRHAGGGIPEHGRGDDPDQHRQRLLERQQQDGADQRSERGAHAAEHHHHDEIAGARPMHGRRADEAGMVGEQRAGEPADRAGDDEAGQPVAEGREADRAHAPVVRARAPDHQAEARVHYAPGEIDRGDEQREAEVIELDAVGEVDETGELAALANAQPVVGAVAVEPDAEIVDELGEGERD